MMDNKVIKMHLELYLKHLYRVLITQPQLKILDIFVYF